MTPLGRFFFWLGSVTLTATLGFKLTTGTPEVKPEPKELLATINKQPVTREEIGKVYPLYRGTCVGQLVIDLLLSQALKSKKLPNASTATPDTSALTASGTPLRRLVLSEWPDSRLRQFHALFSKELTSYEVTCLQIVTSEKGAIEEDLEREVDLGSLAARYCVDEQGQRHEWRQWYTRSEMEEQFGARMAARLSSLQPGQATGLISKSFVLGLHQKRSSFEDLRPSLEQRAVDSRSAALIYELLAKAKITAGAALGGTPEALEYRL